MHKLVLEEGSFHVPLGFNTSQIEICAAYYRRIVRARVFLEHGPRLAKSWLKTGDERLKEGSKFPPNPGELEKSIESFSAAARFDPKSPEPYLGIGCALYALGRPNEGMRFYNRANALNPEDPHALIGIGVSYIEIGEYHNGIANLLKAIELGAECPCPYNLLGLAYSRVGDFGNALDALGKAQEFGATASAHATLANLCNIFYPKYQSSATKHALRALELGPEYFTAYGHLGDAFRLQGNSQEAKYNYTLCLRQFGMIPPGTRTAGFYLWAIRAERGLRELVVSKSNLIEREAIETGRLTEEHVKTYFRCEK